MNAESKSSKATQKATMNPVRNVADASKVPSFQDIACDIENNTSVEKHKNVNENINYIEYMETDKFTEPISTDNIESVDYNHPIRTLQERAVKKRRTLQSNIAVTELEQMISSLDAQIEQEQIFNRIRKRRRLKKKRAQLANKLKCRVHDEQNCASNLEKMRKYHEQNQEINIEKMRNYHEQNRETNIEIKIKYHEQNREINIEKMRKYHEQNQELISRK